MSIATLKRKRAWWRVKEIAAYRSWRRKVKALRVGHPDREDAYEAWEHARFMRREYDRDIIEAKSASMKPLELSRKGADFIEDKEGSKAYPYNDSAGHATIGIGHLIHYGKVTAADNKKWGHLTETEIYSLFMKDVDRFEKVVNEVFDKCVANGHPRPTQEQFDACVSFSLNVGTDGFRNSELARAIINGRARGDHRSETGSLMMNWLRPPELRRRREAERDLFNTGTTYRHINS